MTFVTDRHLLLNINHHHHHPDESPHHLRGKRGSVATVAARWLLRCYLTRCNQLYYRVQNFPHHPHHRPCHHPHCCQNPATLEVIFFRRANASQELTVVLRDS